MKVNVFIMAGGSGTRLAPLSLNLPGKLPKQFLSLVGKNTLLQEAILRIPEKTPSLSEDGPFDPCEITIIPEIRFEDEVNRQADSIGKEIDVLSEPFGCNTAAAIMLGALSAYKRFQDEEAVLFFMPADHMMDKETFQKLFNKACSVAQDTDKIITLGIKPTRPETGYGYIKVKSSQDDVKNVDSFVEKPDLQTAKDYLESGDYFWNAGIFIFKIKTIFEAMKRDSPEIFDALWEIKDELSLENIERQYTKIKEQGNNISIDFAVMEKEAGNMLLLPASPSLDWNDVGGWVALEKYLKKDDSDNLYLKGFEPVDSENNTVFNYTDKEIVLEGCKELLVVFSNNGILVTKRQDANRAKEIIPGISDAKVSEKIDCENVEIKNDKEIYLGVVSLKDYRVEHDGERLNIKKV